MPTPEPRFSKIRNIIAEELDVSQDELQDDDVEFSEIGLDAILAPVVISRISRDIGLQLPEDVFWRCRNVGQLRRHIAATLNDTQPDPAKALSVLIRGNPARGSKNIFLFPDGSGSAMAYAGLQAPSPDYCLYSMHSPFLDHAGGYTCSIENLASIWAQEIQTIQPRGPYILGGWSAGGYYSFEAMKYLHRRGEVVEKIILIDSPCRTDFEALPMDVVLYLSSHNLMGNGSSLQTPEWLVNHFEATLKAVSQYAPSKMASPTTFPDVFIIWAADALLPRGTAVKTGLDLNIRVTRFLLEQRDNFGPNGWEKLFPGAKIAIKTMPGNHFNLVHQPNVESLTQLLRDVFQGGWISK